MKIFIPNVKSNIFLDPQCSYKGSVYSVGDKIQDNCNTCTCQVRTRDDNKATRALVPMYQEPTESTDSCMSVVCSQDTCMTDTELLDRITRDSDTWVPTNYSSFWGVTLEEGVRGRLGARWPKPPVRKIFDLDEVVGHIGRNSCPFGKESLS